MDWNWYNCPSCGAEWRGPLGWKPDDKNMGQHELNCPDRLAAQARLAAYEVARADDDTAYEAGRAATEGARLDQAIRDLLQEAKTQLKRIRRNAARRGRYAARKSQ